MGRKRGQIEGTQKEEGVWRGKTWARKWVGNLCPILTSDLGSLQCINHKHYGLPSCANIFFVLCFVHLMHMCLLYMKWKYLLNYLLSGASIPIRSWRSLHLVKNRGRLGSFIKGVCKIVVTWSAVFSSKCTTNHLAVGLCPFPREGKEKR